jgi:hypothetical protein
MVRKEKEMLMSCFESTSVADAENNSHGLFSFVFATIAITFTRALKNHRHSSIVPQKASIFFVRSFQNQD